MHARRLRVLALSRSIPTAGRKAEKSGNGSFGDARPSRACGRNQRRTEHFIYHCMPQREAVSIAGLASTLTRLIVICDWKVAAINCGQQDCRQHRAILDAAIAGDVETAKRLVNQHVTDTGREIAVLLRERGAARHPAESVK